MSKEKIYIFDTTLRDGAQTQGVDFSIDEKNRIATALSKLGVDYIEAGWPGANPTDTNFFNKPPKLSSSTLVAFGMTKKSGRSAENDPGRSFPGDSAAPHLPGASRYVKPTPATCPASGTCANCPVPCRHKCGSGRLPGSSCAVGREYRK